MHLTLQTQNDPLQFDIDAEERTNCFFLLYCSRFMPSIYTCDILLWRDHSPTVLSSSYYSVGWYIVICENVYVNQREGLFLM